VARSETAQSCRLALIARAGDLLLCSRTLGPPPSPVADHPSLDQSVAFQQGSAAGAEESAVSFGRASLSRLHCLRAATSQGHPTVSQNCPQGAVFASVHCGTFGNPPSEPPFDKTPDALLTFISIGLQSRSICKPRQCKSLMPALPIMNGSNFVVGTWRGYLLPRLGAKKTRRGPNAIGGGANICRPTKVGCLARGRGFSTCPPLCGLGGSAFSIRCGLTTITARGTIAGATTTGANGATRTGGDSRSGSWPAKFIGSGARPLSVAFKANVVGAWSAV
jgi:hypothetical protein